MEHISKPRILIVCDGGLDHGGIQAVIMASVRNLSSMYVFDALVSTNKERYYDREFLSYGGKIFRVPRYEGPSILMHHFDVLLYGLTSYPRIKRIIKINGPYQAIHCHNNYESSNVLSISKKEGIPVRVLQAHVVTKYGKGHISRKLFNYFLRKGFRNANVRIGCSAEACESLFGQQRYTVVPNPYDETRYDIRKYKRSTQEVLSIIQVGSYNKNKNQLFTVKVFSIIKKRFKNALLRFVGFELESGYLEQVKNEIEKLGIKANVQFFPDDTDIPKLLSESSYFVLPSVSEGFGIVLIEAQAMGMKCFSSDSVPSLTNCGGCRYLPVDDCSAEKWANAICNSFISDRGIHTSYDCGRFSTSNYINSMKTIYRGDYAD